MQSSVAGAIDCDVHPAMPGVPALLPYLDDYWRDQFTNRHIDRLPFTLTSYPPTSPLSARPDWRPAPGLPGGDLDADPRAMRSTAFGLRYAICNPLHGAIALFNEDMAAALCSAVNDWMAKELLDREPRLRASILVPPQDPELAVAEIERLAPRPALRAGAAAGDGRDAARPARQLADLSRRRRSTGWPSASMPAAPTAIAPTAAGWPSYQSRTTWRSRRPSRPSC